MLRSGTHRGLRLAFAVTGAVVLAVGGLSAPAYAAGTGSITGHLTDGGTPVSNANVFLFDTNYTYAGSSYTDSTGAFQFSGLAAAGYRIQFNAGPLTQWYHQQTSFYNANTVTVVDGQTTTVEETVRPSGTISGHVYNPDGTPAAYAQVNASEVTGSGGYGYTSTDGSGSYSLRYLTPGSYQVNFRNSAGLTQYANNSTSYSGAATFAVAAGSNTTVDQTFLPYSTVTGTIRSRRSWRAMRTTWRRTRCGSRC